jgi:hypothetical protein
MSTIKQSILLFLFLMFISACGMVALDQIQSEPTVSYNSAEAPITTALTHQTKSGCHPSPTGGPTDNPIAVRYGANAYPFSDNIRWCNVKNIRDFSGKTIIDQYNAARDEATSEGGGVVYFPAGDYTFTDDLLLTQGVVIRGATPDNKDAQSQDFAPPAHFLFPAYAASNDGEGTDNSTAFKKIRTTTPDTDSNIGLVWLDINRAGIELEGNPDDGKNQNIVIFGVRTNNVAEPDPSVPDTSFQQPWQRWSYRFAANISIQAASNVLVANTRHNDAITDNIPQEGYQVKDAANKVVTLSGNQAVFNYTDHYGIRVNRGKSSLAATPQTDASLFRPGITIRDNWIFHTMRVAIHAAGEGMIIRDNVIRDQQNKTAWVDPTGKKLVKNAATLENRAIDWSGWNVQINDNNYEVYRHQLRDGNYLSVDGEGILIQECCGGSLVNGVQITRNNGNTYIGLYKVRDIANVTISENSLKSTTSGQGDLMIYVSADTNNKKYTAKNVKIEKNTVFGSIVLAAKGGSGSQNVIRDNIDPSSSNTITFSCEAQPNISNNNGFQVLPCK